MSKLKLNYSSPTPKRLRQLGDALLAVFTLVSGSSIITDNKTLAIISLLIGVLGKFLTNFFTDIPSDEQK